MGCTAEYLVLQVLVRVDGLDLDVLDIPRLQNQSPPKLLVVWVYKYLFIIASCQCKIRFKDQTEESCVRVQQATALKQVSPVTLCNVPP